MVCSSADGSDGNCADDDVGDAEERELSGAGTASDSGCSGEGCGVKRARMRSGLTSNRSGSVYSLLRLA